MYMDVKIVAFFTCGLASTFMPSHGLLFSRPNPINLISHASLTPQAIALSPTRLLALLEEPDDEAPTEENDANDETDVKRFLQMKFPAAYSMLDTSPTVWKVTASKSTLFSPNAAAFENIGEKKRQQLQDERNLETIQKMAEYHVVMDDAVPSYKFSTEDWKSPKPKEGEMRKLTVEGLVTVGGMIKVGRSKRGGFMGIGAKEDGGAVIGPSARIVQSFQVGECLIHEVDAFVNPDLLWRYFDQLRIPGF